MKKPSSADTNKEAWKYFNNRLAPDQKSPDSWAYFLAGWLAKSANLQERKVRGL